MKFVKTIHQWEAGGERVTPFGTLRFSSAGMCRIEDDALADAVIECSPSLVEASDDDLEAEKALGKLKEAEKVEAIKSDKSDVGSFLANASNPVVAEATSLSSKVIGTPEGESDEGSFNPSATAPAPITTANVEDAPIITTAENNEGIVGVKATDEGGDDSDNAVLRETLGGFSYSDLSDLIEGTGVNLKEDYTHNETKSKAGLIDIIISKKIEL